MHITTLLLTLLPLLTATPSNASQHNPPHLRHRRLAEQAHPRHESPRSAPVALEARTNEAHREARKVLVRRNVMKRGQQCRPRTTGPQQVAAVATTSSAVTSSTTTWSAPAATSSATDDGAGAENFGVGGGQAASTTTSTTDNWTPTTTTSAWSDPTPSSSSSDSDDSGFSLNVAGLLAVTDNTCGACGSNDNQPNGAQSWLNCGVSSDGKWDDGSGWTPPYVTMDQLISTELTADGVFAPCAQYIEKFKTIGGNNKVHPIILASFAMQESTCNAGAVGGNGEAGLMQITPANCEAGNDCWNVDYNINRGAQLFSQMVDGAGGNVLQAIGTYNGWQKGMTISSATGAKNKGHCFQQNNLDYLFQFVNGWMQNKNAYSMGYYFNLNGC